MVTDLCISHDRYRNWQGIIVIMALGGKFDAQKTVNQSHNITFERDFLLDV